MQELNASDSLSSAEIKPCDAVEEKPSIKIAQQRQAIIAGFVGTALLVSSVALCIMEMHVIAVVGGIVGLACVSFVLYNTLKPITKLEEVKDVEQPVVQSSLNPT
ncbi:MAG: hypothetical protein LKM43_00005 [Wolbachia endosymbiont of Penenirmus auritus]|nr:hypothetical protein [Wolbachia endosymbiont of Penenirmus auritus]